MECPQCHKDNPADARFCNGCGHALPEVAGISGEPLKAAPFEGERKLVTVLFSDLSGYTAMTERLDPEEVQAIMSRIAASSGKCRLKETD